MATTPQTDVRTTLTKGQFLKIYRWQQQMPLKQLAVMTGLSVATLVKLENDEPLRAGGPDCESLANLLGCTSEMWERVGIEPGFPEAAASAGAPAAAAAFAAQINRIAAMPEAFRLRQMQVIQKELGYIDA